MREDVKVMKMGDLECPNVIQFPVKKQKRVRRGDLIQFNKPHSQPQGRGRVLGIVVNPDDGKSYFVVIEQFLSGHLCERWVLPEDIINYEACPNHYCHKAEWLNSEKFLETSINVARKASDLMYLDLLMG